MPRSAIKGRSARARSARIREGRGRRRRPVARSLAPSPPPPAAAASRVLLRPATKTRESLRGRAGPGAEGAPAERSEPRAAPARPEASARTAAAAVEPRAPRPRVAEPPPAMGAAARSLRLALGLLLLGTLLRPADACSCSPVHPQQAFCNADVVIRAKAVSVKEVDSGNDIYGNPIKRIQYEIKQIKMFKGPDKDIEFIYTAPSSAVCGVSLDVGGKKEYLIAGKAEGNGKMHITLCDFIVPWDTLSTTQKKSLNHRYQMGCECKITRCPMIPCYISSPDECLWMDWVTEKNINGHQAKFFACIKRSDGSCAWYRGAAPPKQEFLDIEDP
ncbi:metalloproteinase inhibitor 2 [Meles meles]|nr:metalloproteinase inhibitor 2 [Meles meles]